MLILFIIATVISGAIMFMNINSLYQDIRDECDYLVIRDIILLICSAFWLTISIIMLLSL